MIVETYEVHDEWDHDAQANEASQCQPSFEPGDHDARLVVRKLHTPLDPVNLAQMWRVDVPQR